MREMFSDMPCIVAVVVGVASLASVVITFLV